MLPKLLAEVERLLGKVREYTQHAKDIEPQFIPHPATWFNQERWTDEGVVREANPWLDETEATA
jgi:hypothetical protein